MGTGSVPGSWVLPAPTLLRGCFHGSGGAIPAAAAASVSPRAAQPPGPACAHSPSGSGGFVLPGCVRVSRACILRAVKLLPWKLPVDMGINVMPGLCLHRDSGRE